MDEARIGRVKWFSDEKGYGFITALDGTEYFVHATGIRGRDKDRSITLTENQDVIFDLAFRNGKVSAVNVRQTEGA